MRYDIKLHLIGYTNQQVVKCLYNKSPLEFYSRIKSDNVFAKQLDILKMAWPKINKETFLNNVCSSSLDKRVWINKRELIQNHRVSVRLSPITFEDIKHVMKRSTLLQFDSFDQIKE